MSEHFSKDRNIEEEVTREQKIFVQMLFEQEKRTIKILESPHAENKG